MAEWRGLPWKEGWLRGSFNSTQLNPMGFSCHLFHFLNIIPVGISFLLGDVMLIEVSWCQKRENEYLS
jgi:hypothetical protein